MIRIILSLLLIGCASEQANKYRGTFELKCIDGDVWVYSDHSSGSLGVECDE